MHTDRPNNFQFTADLELYHTKNNNGAWHFVTVPKDISSEIDDLFGEFKRGWGSLKVNVTIGETIWDTSIFPIKKDGTYFLPIKADVREKEDIALGDTVSVELDIIV